MISARWVRHGREIAFVGYFPPNGRPLVQLQLALFMALLLLTMFAG